jgi:hypothetical protein
MAPPRCPPADRSCGMRLSLHLSRKIQKAFFSCRRHASAASASASAPAPPAGFRDCGGVARGCGSGQYKRRVSQSEPSARSSAVPKSCQDAARPTEPRMSMPNGAWVSEWSTSAIRHYADVRRLESCGRQHTDHPLRYDPRSPPWQPGCRPHRRISRAPVAIPGHGAQLCADLRRWRRVLPVLCEVVESGEPSRLASGS